MKLQILIPHYNEEAEVVKPLLDSIAIQQNVDFGEVVFRVNQSIPHAHNR